MEIYEGGKQYNSKVDRWEAIKTSMLETEPAKKKKKKKLTRLMNNRLLAVIKGHNIKMYIIQRLICVIFSLIGVDQFLISLSFY